MHEHQHETGPLEREGAEAGSEQLGRPGPRIYVASLSDYNAGRLHGSWLDAAQDAEALHEAVAAMLGSSREPGAEEWAIHDYEGFGPLPLGEYEDLAVVSAVALGIARHGPAFAAWASHEDTDNLSEEGLAGFEEAYRGTWDSTEAYAADLLDDAGATQLLEELPDWLQPYVQLDVAGFARDLELGGDILTFRGDDGTYVFDAGP